MSADQCGSQTSILGKTHCQLPPKYSRQRASSRPKIAGIDKLLQPIFVIRNIVLFKIMSGPNGDPNISAEDGLINDDDDFGSEGNTVIILSINYCQSVIPLTRSPDVTASFWRISLQCRLSMILTGINICVVCVCR